MEEGGTSKEGQTEERRSAQGPLSLTGAWIGRPHWSTVLGRSSGSYVPSLRISVCGSSKRHGSNLALDAQLEASTELYHKSPGVSVSGVGDQGQGSVQVVVHHPVSLIIRGAFQSVNSICFHIDRKELALELLFKVGPGLDGKDAGVHFLAKEVLGPPHGSSIFEKGEGPQDFLLVAAKLFWGQT